MIVPLMEIFFNYTFTFISFGQNSGISGKINTIFLYLMSFFNLHIQITSKGSTMTYNTKGEPIAILYASFGWKRMKQQEKEEKAMLSKKKKKKGTKTGKMIHHFLLRKLH